MRVGLFAGDLLRAPAEAVCTSTNPELKLMVGTGGAVRTAGGWEVQEECDRLVAASGRRILPVGSAHVTGAGRLPFRCVIHCVAIDVFHGSSAEVVAACTRSALDAAEARGLASLALPLFATGNGPLELAVSLGAIADVLLAHSGPSVQETWIAVHERHRAGEARRLLEGRVPDLLVRP